VQGWDTPPDSEVTTVASNASRKSASFTVVSITFVRLSISTALGEAH